jgi:glycosyltransferase involved in cell wall biosynthesis
MFTPETAEIVQKSFPIADNCRFSIIIPSWNNLPMLKLCVESIRKNSRFKHQIIIHVNEGADNTRGWVEENLLDHSFSARNVGVSLAVNSAAGMAKTDYILYLNDDMYVCPDWDFYLWEAIERQPDHKFFLSATAIEPHDVGKKIAIAPYNFGTNPENFDEVGLLQQYAQLPMPDWEGSSWPPNVVHKSLWNQVGGYSLEFFPGFYSDPDFSMKLWKAGVRRFQGVSKSRVYHFLEASTNKLKNRAVNNGRKLFLKKWGITSRVFYHYYLRMGNTNNINEPLSDPKGISIFMERVISFFKKYI